MFAGHVERNTTLVLVTHDTALAARCDRVVRLRSGRIDSARRGCTRMSIASAPVRSGGATLSLRLALRELRAGLARLSRLPRLHRARRDGDRRGRLVRAEPRRRARARGPRHPRRRRVVLAHSSRGERRGTGVPCPAAAPISVAATMRAMARAADGRASLVEIKAVDSAYPLYGSVVLDAGDLAAALAQRDGVHGAVADEALFARLDLEPGARLLRRQCRGGDPRHPEDRARQARRRHRLRTAPSDERGCACGRPACSSRAAWCAGIIG